MERFGAYYVMATESLHDGRFVKELDPLAEACRLVDGLHGHSGVRLALHDVFSDAFVNHSERALAELSEDADLLARHLPLVWNIN